MDYVVWTFWRSDALIPCLTARILTIIEYSRQQNAVQRIRATYYSEFRRSSTSTQQQRQQLTTAKASVPASSTQRIPASSTQRLQQRQRLTTAADSHECSKRLQPSNFRQLRQRFSASCGSCFLTHSAGSLAVGSHGSRSQCSRFTGSCKGMEFTETNIIQHL